MERFPWSRALGLVLVLFLFLMFFQSIMQEPSGGNGMLAPGQSAEISYTAFKDHARDGNIRKVVILEKEVQGEFVNAVTVPGKGVTASRFTTQLPPIEDPSLLALLEESQVEVNIKREEDKGFFWIFLANALPLVLFIGLMIFIFRRSQNKQMGPFGQFGQVKARLYDMSMPQVTFRDVAGLNAQKRELAEIVDFLQTPEKYEKIGGRVPKGILLVGPPGTGKTLLAKAVAGEAGVPFLSTSASEFIEMFVGVGASRVRDLFKKARSKSPSIIFIDEIDAVGRARGTGLGGGHDEREQTLNQLLGEMDGFEGHERVIIIAATNRPDVLDPALLRPGRFDREVVNELPSMDDREAILKVHTRKIPMADDVDLRMMARSTPGMSGADLENLCNEAALFGAREAATKITMRHMDMALDKIIMGLERPNVMNEEERRITAYHEAGHTLIARLTPGTDPVYKVTILPRGPALGAMHQVPERDRTHMPKTHLMARLAVAMGGRASELIMFDDTSTGAQSDLRYSTNLAEKMVCQWGMSERVGPMTFSRGEQHVFLGKTLAQEKTWSEQMGWIIDQEIEAIVRGAEKRAHDLLTKNRDKLDRLAEALLEREELTGEEVDKVLAGEELPPKEENGNSGGEPEPEPTATVQEAEATETRPAPAAEVKPEPSQEATKGAKPVTRDEFEDDIPAT